MEPSHFSFVEWRMRVEINGPIGNGKTTLALGLSHQPGWRALEHPEDVPFWRETYSDEPGLSFKKDIGLLIAHGAAIRKPSSRLLTFLSVTFRSTRILLMHASASGRRISRGR